MIKCISTFGWLFQLLWWVIGNCQLPISCVIICDVEHSHLKLSSRSYFLLVFRTWHVSILLLKRAIPYWIDWAWMVLTGCTFSRIRFSASPVCFYIIAQTRHLWSYRLGWYFPAAPSRTLNSPCFHQNSLSASSYEIIYSSCLHLVITGLITCSCSWLHLIIWLNVI